MSARMRWQAVALGVVAFFGSPFVVTGLFRLGIPGVFPFVVLLAVAVAAWAKRHRAIAVGLAGGTLAWAVALFLILSDMGDGIKSIG